MQTAGFFLLLDHLGLEQGCTVLCHLSARLGFVSPSSSYLFTVDVGPLSSLVEFDNRPVFADDRPISAE